MNKYNISTLCNLKPSAASLQSVHAPQHYDRNPKAAHEEAHIMCNCLRACVCMRRYFKDTCTYISLYTLAYAYTYAIILPSIISCWPPPPSVHCEGSCTSSVSGKMQVSHSSREEASGCMHLAHQGRMKKSEGDTPTGEASAACMHLTSKR